MSSRRRLLVINQYYATVEASGEFLRQLCDDLAETMDVDVVAARREGGASPAVPAEGVTIRWVPTPRFPKSSLALRALNYLGFLVGTALAVVRCERPDVALCMTDPPMIGLIGLAYSRIRRVPLVLVVQDVHPEVGVISGRLTAGPVVRILGAIQRLLLRKSDRVVVIGEAMRSRLVERGAAGDRTVVIPNWVDLETVSPKPRDNRWARAHGLTASFTVMHSGNLGYLQDLDTFLELAQRMEGVRFILVGEGSRKAELVERARREAITNITFLPHQPRRDLALTLAAADVQVVSMLAGLSGFVEPSKTYGILASARPVLAAVDSDTEAASLVREAGCGVVVAAGDVDAAEAAVTRLRDLSGEEREAMGSAGRALVESRYSRIHATESYRRVIAEVAA